MVYDAFQFLNELDLLEIRLHTHNDYVDKFIITECILTHSGNPKPLNYLNNKHLFEKFNHKIIHVVLDKFPDEVLDHKMFLQDEVHHNIIQARDTYQRMYFLSQLSFADTDTILMLDTDELLDFKKIKPTADTKITSLVLNNYYYYINNQGSCTSDGGIMSSYKTLKDAVGNNICKNIRYRSKSKKELYHASDGVVGWHFSFLGGENQIKYKIESWSHSEYNTPSIKNGLELNLKNNLDIFNRGYSYKVVPLDDSFPHYILENKAKFAHLIYETK
jgi:beta-1,4-mannosyl-glycoprotein beta-1,4-N-acetylglucosaminyltransferase